jgi:hypothetical protein
MKQTRWMIAVLCLLGIIIFFGTSFAVENKKPAAPAVDPNAFASLMDAVSRTRSYIEFYYMETGDYPESLEYLEQDLNSLLPRTAAKISVPKNPITGQKFGYQVDENQDNYTLFVGGTGIPGMENMKLNRVDWAGFNAVVAERKSKFLQMLCVENIKGIATALEFYGRDTKASFPRELKVLVPKYLANTPVCPQSGKAYEFNTDGKEYVIGCPECEKHGLKSLKFSTKEGWIVR